MTVNQNNPDMPNLPVDTNNHAVMVMLQELVAQVQLSNSTAQLSTERMNVVANQLQDTYTELSALSEQLVTLKENLITAIEAEHRVIAEQDRQVDDLATITQRIGQMEITYQQALQGAQAAREGK